ncbi:MAG: hypothetical protein AAF349_09930 [Cyanobacteria bacterium P01_A01_bin.68]
MSIYRKRILAFIGVIESQPNIFSDSDWAELHELTKELSNEDNDDEEIFSRIKIWMKLEHRKHILHAYQEQLKGLDNSSYSIDLEKNLGAGRSGRNSNPLNETEATNQSSLGLLNNAIQKNSPLS